MGAVCRPSSGRTSVRLEAAGEIPAFLQRYFDAAPLWDGRAVRIGEGLWPLLQRCWSLPERGRATSPLCRALIAAPGTGWLDEQDVIEGMARGGDWPDPSRLQRAAIGRFVEAVLEDLASTGRDQPALRLELCFALAPLAVQQRFAIEGLVEALREDGLDERHLEDHLVTRQPDLATLAGTWCLEAGRPTDRATRRGHAAASVFHVAITRRSYPRLDLRLRCRRPLAGYFRRTLEGVSSVPVQPATGSR